MRRRHLLALVILALVVATVVAAGGPMGVWDAVTLRTVEEYWPNGRAMHRYEVRLWESVEDNALSRGDYTFWHENGQKEFQMHSGAVVQVREWSPTGRLLTYLRSGDGVETTVHGDEIISGDNLKQERSVNGVVIETRTSPPWFTEEEILQAVEGVEE